MTTIFLKLFNPKHNKILEIMPEANFFQRWVLLHNDGSKPILFGVTNNKLVSHTIQMTLPTPSLLTLPGTISPSPLQIVLLTL